jgi:hypothetical protein
LIRLSFPYLAAALLLFPLFAPTSAGQDEQADSLLAMRVQDERVAMIGHRLAINNLAFCADRSWLPGFTVHELSQYGAGYRDAAIRAFGVGMESAVLAVAAGGPAERSGIRRDDVLLRLDGEALPVGPGTDGPRALMERLLNAIEGAFADGAANVDLRRGTLVSSVLVQAEQGCATRFQVAPSSDLNAYADGRYVKVTTRMAYYLSDDQELAALLAHEFAHNMLRHRNRLDSAGVARGFLGNFGRNARLIRETESEADRLSVYLLDRAGYDPEATVRFWQRFGSRGLNFIGSPTHSSPGRRIELFRAEIEKVRQARAEGRVAVPDFLPARAAPTGG